MILGFWMFPCSFIVKRPTKWISFTFFSFTCNISLQHLAKICHHVLIPSSLITPFHFFNIPVKAFFLFLTVITKIFREVIDMAVMKVNLFLFNILRISGPSKTPALNLASDILDNLIHKYLKQSSSLFSDLMNCFIKPSLICRGGRRIFVGSTKGFCGIFFEPGSKDFSSLIILKFYIILFYAFLEIIRTIVNTLKSQYLLQILYRFENLLK